MIMINTVGFENKVEKKAITHNLFKNVTFIYNDFSTRLKLDNNSVDFDASHKIKALY